LPITAKEPPAAGADTKLLGSHPGFLQKGHPQLLQKSHPWLLQGQSPAAPYMGLQQLHDEFSDVFSTDCRLVRQLNKKAKTHRHFIFHISYFFYKFRYFSALSRHFPHLTFKKTQIFSNFNSFNLFACPNIAGTKFRYFPSTFG
jgi:hypothetical protein